LQKRIQVSVSDVEPQPRRVSDILTAIAGVRDVEVDEGTGQSISEDTIARTSITVAHDFVGAETFEAQRGVVKGAKEVSTGLDLVRGKAP
jgi:hypothetical protein